MSLVPASLAVKQTVIVITGAAGFLGSALTVDLSREYCVVAIDRRKPSADLLTAASQTHWHQVDIADSEALARTFQHARQSLGRVDFVLHFAAFYHFGTDWKAEYDRTNLDGTLNVLRSAEQCGAKRVVFASSIAAMEPAPAGAVLTEKASTAGWIPYAKSKSAGEVMVRDASARLPGLVLRIGGAFSEWCELPPLASLIGLWAGRSPFGRLLVGEGMTGIPYIHRHDVVRIARACIEAHETLGPYEVFLASQQGTVTHKDLYAVIHQRVGEKAAPAAIPVPRWAARLGLHARRTIGPILGRAPFERPWMLNYVDRPWVVDTTYTRNRLGWSCTEGMGILDRLPTMLDLFMQHRRIWERRNRVRNQGEYAYYG
ncbi:MAG: NAD-dependent epimerase/dehydratase family protein [Thermoguttaceae bacterium]